MSKKRLIGNIIIYIFGILITGLGANLIVRSNLGSGAWDAVAKNFGFLFPANFAVAATIFSSTILIIVIIYNKNLKFLIGFIPIVGMFFSIYFWDIIIFNDYYAATILIQALFFITGIVVLSFALGSIVISTLPAMAYDELTIMFMKILKIPSFFKTRIMIELFAVALAICFGFIANEGFGFVSYGTIIISLLIGPMISLQMKWMSKLLGQKRV